MKRFVFSFLCAALFSSCATFFVPGEARQLLKNFASEYYTLGNGYFETKNYKKAADCYKKAMQNEDVHDAAFYKLARSYALSSDWDSARSCYEELLSKDKDNFSLKTAIAYIKAAGGDIDGAISDYSALAKERPHEELVLESLVALFLTAGRAEDAEKQYFVLKADFPDNAKLSSFSKKLSELLPDFKESQIDKKIEESPDKK